jgi:hypothetical protein
VKIKELFEEEESLLLELIQGLLQNGKKVVLNASGAQANGNARRSGRIVSVRKDSLVYDYDANRDPKDRTISHSFFIMKQPVDEHYTVRKIDGIHTLVDLE